MNKLSSCDTCNCNRDYAESQKRIERLIARNEELQKENYEMKSRLDMPGVRSLIESTLCPKKEGRIKRCSDGCSHRGLEASYEWSHAMSFDLDDAIYYCSLYQFVVE